MWDKVRKRIVDACDVMDMVMAAVVVIGIVIAVIGIFPQIGELWRHREETVAFLEFSGCSARRCHWCGIPKNVM